jgi:hypothetical protein
VQEVLGRVAGGAEDLGADAGQCGVDLVHLSRGWEGSNLTAAPIRPIIQPAEE